ncbi:MAG: hypothetical protein IRY99_12795 [Isosphaeraceae bacterium]|nr:hypothetical protein [Isosphaeraceae bacterium]
MSDPESLPRLVEDLIEVMQLQARELEKLVVHIEQAIGRLPEESQLAVIASELSELSELKQRARGLGARREA